MQDPSGHSWPAMGPVQMLLNHVDFDQYHLFRAESRVLSGKRSGSPAWPPMRPSGHDQPSMCRRRKRTWPMHLPVPPPATRRRPIDAIASSEGEAPEISTAEATGLPETPAHPADQAAAILKVHPQAHAIPINARLVDVNVVALDKKGRPVTDLKPGDFEIYDNGVKQNVSMFTQANAATAARLPHLGTVRDQRRWAAFSNHAAREANPKPLRATPSSFCWTEAISPWLTSPWSANKPCAF